MNLPKGLAKKIAATGFMSPKGMQAPPRMGGQSGFNPPRPPMGMATRPPVIANKARGTQSSSMYRPMPNALNAAIMF
jgi:hypothetical protein